MKIAVRGGHCPNVPGSRGIIDELKEDRLVKNAVIKYLNQMGVSVLDVTPPDSISSSSADLSYGVNKANNWGADLFVSIHFNNAYSTYNGALGTEVCVYSEYDIAGRVVNKMASLGFRNRGQKVRTGLYELKHTSMKSMIVEVCFVEATEDVALYNKVGYDYIGKTIAERLPYSSQVSLLLAFQHFQLAHCRFLTLSKLRLHALLSILAYLQCRQHEYQKSVRCPLFPTFLRK